MADMIICKGCNKERYSNDDFTIDNAREDVLDDGNVLCNYCWIAHDDYVEAESFEADEWNNDEYVDLAKRVPKRFKEDNLQDAYVEGFLDCLYNQTGGITDEVYDDDFDAESFEADMTVGDGFKLGVGAILGFTAIGAAFGLLGNVIGNLIGNKGE
jgi:hypothetical protein